MAQDFAPLLRSIWSDEDFRALTVDAQHAYLMLLSHPDRNSAGVLSLTVRRWAQLSADATPDRLLAALAELDEAGFVVVDEDTEEVLVRAYVRRGAIYEQVRLHAAALREASRVHSPRLRAILGQPVAHLPQPGNARLSPRRSQANQAIRNAFRRIGERDGFRCRMCGHGRTLTVDHIISVVNGGTDDDDNLQLLCRSHNSSKGAR